MTLPPYPYNFDPSLNLVVAYFGNATSCVASVMDKMNFAEAMTRPQTGGNTYSLTPQSATIIDKTPNALFTNGMNPGAQ